MAFLSTDSTPRERLSRLLSLLRRVRMYWRSTAIIVALGVTVSLVFALTTKRVWRSETTLLYRETIQTGQPAGTRTARLGPKLKDMIYARPKLSSVIEEFGLYPEKTARSMVEAVGEMQTNLGFRSRDSDSYVISFSHHDPMVAQQVTARLADLIIEDYQRENMTSAKMTLDFRKRELEGASKQVEEASRLLATFLADHPQFQWGLGDSPYAPTPQAQGGPVHAPVARPQAPAVPRIVDPELLSLERRMAQVDAKLNPPQAAPAGEAAPPANVAEAQKMRDAAAAAVSAAEAGLADKLRVVTELHPDAVLAKGRLETARRELAHAESALRAARGGVRPPSDAPSSLSAEERAPLERERASLFQQIAARRNRLQADRQGTAAAPAKTPAKPAAAAAEGTQEPVVPEVVQLETEWHRLRLNLDRARDYLKTSQANERAANMVAEAVESKGETEMAILDPAYLPSRPDKGRGRVFFVGVALSLMFALGLAGARVLLNDTIYDEADVGALGGLPVLAAMPAIPAVEPPRVRAMVPVQEPPTAASMDEYEDYDYEDADTQVVTPPPPPRDQRLHTQTLRWGSPLEMEEMRREAAAQVAAARAQAAQIAEDAQARAAQAAAQAAQVAQMQAPLARVAPDPLARVVAPFGGGRETLNDPEVQEIGDDPAEEGEDALRLLRDVPQHALASLRVLRHRMERYRGEGRMIVSVLSPGPGEGKTTLAARLAMTLAEAERARVILVDGNLARPRVASTLGLKLPGYAGLSYQIRQRMLGHRRSPTGDEGRGNGLAPLGVVRIGPSLWVLAEPALGETYPDVVNSPHFGAALQSLRRCFDYVIIDGPAVLGSGDANVLEDAADGIVLVARASMTRGQSLTRAIAQLGDRRLLGVVLNDVSERPVARKKVEMTQGATA
ncbi:exopolysaccharide transport family protein [Chondromyces crocatus]|uniref:Uncharacterized protein n=1 Tax=Chondromyces crocatus TaxID=52 RepID=A0A0K1EG65_CHOCO|nr:tyrosine-protein kinase domain-containing protein [Chondromyces crocatus]AKT39870.1 uncharacterized protein CMC5_040210 [Chondromyces crocatus]